MAELSGSASNHNHNGGCPQLKAATEGHQQHPHSSGRSYISESPTKACRGGVGHSNGTNSHGENTVGSGGKPGHSSTDNATTTFAQLKFTGKGMPSKIIPGFELHSSMALESAEYPNTYNYGSYNSSVAEGTTGKDETSDGAAQCTSAAPSSDVVKGVHMLRLNDELGCEEIVPTAESTSKFAGGVSSSSKPGPLLASSSKLSADAPPWRGPTSSATSTHTLSQLTEQAESKSFPDFDEEKFQKDEKELVHKVVLTLSSEKYNPHKGSLPSERVQNFVKQSYPSLYTSVVSCGHGNQWHRFIKDHSDVFELVTCEQEGRKLPRIRLLAHADYQEADKRAAQEQLERDHSIVESLKLFLTEHEDDVSVEEFMNAYKGVNPDSGDLPVKGRPAPELPRFRDFVRLIRRYPKLFSYDEVASRIRTADTWTPPPLSTTPKSKTQGSISNSASKIEDIGRDSLVTSNSEISATFSQIPSLTSSLSNTWRGGGSFAMGGEVLFPSSSYLSESASSIRAGSGASEPSTPSSASVKSRITKLIEEMSVEEREKFQSREIKLRNFIVQFLEDEEKNPNQGSVPSERLQNCIKAQNANLYKSVVGGIFSNQWHEFIKYEKEFFELLEQKDAKRTIWRIRLRKHINWQVADHKEKEARDKRENHLMHVLEHYLTLQPDKKCIADDFLNEFGKMEEIFTVLEGIPVTLPARGDFIRFVRRHSVRFSYMGQPDYLISLRESSCSSSGCIATELSAESVVEVLSKSRVEEEGDSLHHSTFPL